MQVAATGPTTVFALTTTPAPMRSHQPHSTRGRHATVPRSQAYVFQGIRRGLLRGLMLEAGRRPRPWSSARRNSARGKACRGLSARVRQCMTGGCQADRADRASPAHRTPLPLWHPSPSRGPLGFDQRVGVSTLMVSTMHVSTAREHGMERTASPCGRGEGRVRSQTGQELRHLEPLMAA